MLLILGGFSICWLPYFIVACLQIYGGLDGASPFLYKSVFSLAMANSGMNPLIYAWKNKNFRRSFAYLLRCKNPDIAYRDTNIVPNNHAVGVAKVSPKVSSVSSSNDMDRDSASREVGIHCISTGSDLVGHCTVSVYDDQLTSSSAGNPITTTMSTTGSTTSSNGTEVTDDRL